MAIGYKNLILIDNSRSVGEANFTLCKETAKYICSNMNPEDSYRIAVFGENVEYLTEYTADASVLGAAIDELSLSDKDTYITDNLADILTEWKEQDVACRSIILFSDGEECEPVRHANEELYYLLEEEGFQVYAIQSVENRNIPAAKNLSAITTISGGRLLLTEFEGSEACSERIMGDKILADIEQRRENEASAFENTEDTSEEKTIDVEEETINTGDGAKKDMESLYIGSDKEQHEQVHIMDTAYSSADNAPIIRNKVNNTGIGLNVIFPALGLVFAIIFAIVIRLIIRRNNRDIKMDKKLLQSISEDIEREARIAIDAEDYDCLTCKLDEGYNATRILEQDECGHDIVLEDCADPTRLFRAVCDDSLIVGRSGNSCDIVIDYDDSVSGRHCELSVKGDSWYVRDLRSSNGTRVNNRKVFQELMLKNGDILGIGRSALQVRI